MRKRTEKLLGIVLKRSSIRESDRIVTLFSFSSGKVLVHASGVRKINSRRGPHLELFNQVAISVSLGRTVPEVCEAEVKSSFPSLKNDILLVGLAFYCAEVVDRLLPERQPHPKVYQILTDTLFRLDRLEPRESAVQGQRIVKEFIVQLLWELGYLPRGKYPKEGITSFVEELIERRVKSKSFLERI